MGDASWLKRQLYAFWMRRGERLAPRRMHGELRATDKLVSFLGYLFLARTVRDKLGLRRVRLAMSGAAPIAPCFRVLLGTRSTSPKRTGRQRAPPSPP
jgi:long-chain acyl-CoA synthetase